MIIFKIEIERKETVKLNTDSTWSVLVRFFYLHLGDHLSYINYQNKHLYHNYFTSSLFWPNRVSGKC